MSWSRTLRNRNRPRAHSAPRHRQVPWERSPSDNSEKSQTRPLMTLPRRRCLQLHNHQSSAALLHSNWIGEIILEAGPRSRTVLAHSHVDAIISAVNNKQRRTLEAVWSEPVKGNIEWARIESLLVALGCQMVEGSGSSVTFDHDGRRATFHRPHPGKEALRYRVQAVREFLQRIGIQP